MKWIYAAILFTPMLTALVFTGAFCLARDPQTPSIVSQNTKVIVAPDKIPEHTFY